MESFEVIVNAERFIIKSNDPENLTYSLFNHATFHVIKKNKFGIWKTIEHRFGTDQIPLDEIGEAIDKYNNQLKQESGLLEG